MKNKIKSSVLAVVLVIAILFSGSSAVYAADKTSPVETVYVLLETTGTAREIIVTNNGVEQKDVEGELPFNIKFSYTLNDESVLPQDVVGNSGDVKITVEITANSKAKTFYKENLALQMQFPIDISDGKATNIVAEKLTGVTVGAVKTFSAIVLPGKSATYEISYKTTAFELQSINFACMPFDLTGTIDFDFSSVGDQITEFQNGFTQYVDGVGQTSAGLSKINTGVKKLASSGKDLTSGYAQTTAGTNALIDAMLSTMPAAQQRAFMQQVKAIKDGQKQLAGSLDEYVNGVTESSVGLKEISTGAKELVKSGSALKKGVDSMVEPLSDLPNQGATTISPISFISADNVSEIQFVMKTDAISATDTKADVLLSKKPHETFWSRLMALFGL